MPLKSESWLLIPLPRQRQNVTTEVIQTVAELTAEAEEMIAFMNETTIGGYEKLLETSESYRSNVGNMNKMMQNFAAKKN